MGDSTCPDCSAVIVSLTCGELFDRLLALDHSRRPPWGPLHGQAVACYFLQHPNAPRAPTDTEPLYRMLDSVLRSDSVGLSPAEGGVVTIHDLAVDGSFPAAGYPDRLARWAAHLIIAKR